MKHLHNLSTKLQIQWIRKIHNKQVTATVKEDGSAVTVGIDADGCLYVSREGKEVGEVERYYNVEDISLERPGANVALYIAAELWIHSTIAWVHGGQPGDAWNCEVVSDNLNVIQYKHTSLVLLHPITNSVTLQPSTPLTKLGVAKAMGTEVMIPTWFINNYNQLDIYYNRRYGSVRFIEEVELPKTDRIIRFLDGMTSYGTVEEILTARLTEVPVDSRDEFKTYRKFFVKELNCMAKNLEAKIEMNREGIVLNDGGNLIKVVNPTFVLANQYIHAVRNCIKKRTFSNDFAQYFPSCPESLIADVHKAWSTADTNKVDSQLLRVMLYTMESHYQRAQTNKTLNDPTGLYDNRYPSHVHHATLVAFKVAIDSLNGW